MRAITLHPEWAWAVCHLGKDVENRPWRPRCVGPGDRIAIHAGMHIGGRPGKASMHAGLGGVQRMSIRAGYVPLAGWDHLRQQEVRSFRDKATDEVKHLGVNTLVRGAVVAVATLGEIVGVGKCGSPWASGPLCWTFTKVEVLSEPIPVKGAQGLWVLNAETIIDERL